ncbi:flagellar basal-body MS-ring/collar protein FliF [Sulfitobacter sp. JB4-11]|uniref:flagellar basal-body MS-ring/collar protein FliF n=1 Tax=Sulfitobacter rhodophyticola TaxID=3238304 RepID=UPI00351916EC
MQELFENFKNLGRQRLLILGGTTFGVLLAMLLGIGAVTRPDYAPIYSNLSVSSASSIEAALTSAGFNVLVGPDGTTISVPQSDKARARMVLAETGMPIDGDPGWELFDQQGGMAMNSFLQKINRVRAMEGELARSIQTLDGIASARVHLVLPDREPFTREAPTPRASVILRPQAGRAVSRKEAIAVRNLVASAVAELDLTRVTVLSASGETILSEDPGGPGQGNMQTAKSAIEDRLSREIENILTARVGAGNARVHVNVELTTQREVIVEQSFNPDQQVVRSTETKTEDQTDTGEQGNVGVENNIPAALADPEGGSTSNRSEADEIVQYEIGNTRREIVREAGEVRRMTVAVLVNGIYAVEDTAVNYSERTPEEMDRLAELVKSAVGFQESRGDTISVDSMRFMDYSMDLGSPIEQSMTDRLAESAVPIIRGLLALLIVGLVMILGVRPLLKRLNEPAAIAQDDEPPAPALPDGETPPAIPQPMGQPSEPMPAPLPASTFAPNQPPMFEAEEVEYIQKQGIRGNLHKRKIDNIQQLADDKPDEVLRVLRSWLRVEAEA